MVVEALIGAALVLFELVAHDASAKRALSVALHLANTFLLLATTALTAWWASGGTPVRVRGQGVVAWSTGVPLAAVLLVGTTGALTALGDTLFPSASVASGFVQDLSRSSHWFVRLRALHPLLAVLSWAIIVTAGQVTRALRPSREVTILVRISVVLAVAQVAAGLLDVVTLAPIAVQLAHLVLADTLWLSLVLTAAAAMPSLSAEAGPPSRPLPPPLQDRRELQAESGATADVA
jgi:heme A synthase